jgi:hypothetical protein
MMLMDPQRSIKVVDLTPERLGKEIHSREEIHLLDLEGKALEVLPEDSTLKTSLAHLEELLEVRAGDEEEEDTLKNKFTSETTSRCRPISASWMRQKELQRTFTYLL